MQIGPSDLTEVLIRSRSLEDSASADVGSLSRTLKNTSVLKELETVGSRAQQAASKVNIEGTVFIGCLHRRINSQ